MEDISCSIRKIKVEDCGDLENAKRRGLRVNIKKNISLSNGCVN